MRRLLAASGAVVVAAALTASAAQQNARAYDVDMTWTTTVTNFKPGAPKQWDRYATSGDPFGQGQVMTIAPRTKNETAFVDFRGRNRHGTYTGSMKLTKRYVTTKPNKQVIAYTGKGYFLDGSGRYEDIVGLGSPLRFKGGATCTRKSCEAEFHVTGTVEY